MQRRLRHLAALLGLCSWIAVLATEPAGMRGCANLAGEVPGAAHEMETHRHDGDETPPPCRCFGHMCCVVLAGAPMARAAAAPPAVLAIASAAPRAPAEPTLGATSLLQPPALGPPLA